MALIGLLVGIQPATAADWMVLPDGSGDRATVQDAIDVAVTGDTIILGDGVFTGPGNVGAFVNKGLTIRSESGDPSACILDGEDKAQIFRFQDSASTQSVMDGVGLRNGNHVQWGGAIVVYLSGSPIIRNCIITDCESIRGGAIAAVGTGSPTFENCWILNSRATQGGGIFVNRASGLVLDGCVIAGNEATGFGGGGMFVGDHASVIFRNSTLALNRATRMGGGFFIHAFSTLTVEGSLIRRNSAGETGMDAFLWDQTVDVDVSCSNTDPVEFSGYDRVSFDVSNDARDPYLCGWVDYSVGDTVDIDDVHLASNSPCLPASSPCGMQIGALDSSCGDVVPIQIESWRSLKSHF